MNFPKKITLTPSRTLILGFAAIILFGACLLALPFASRDGQSLGFLSALFTATSATCVTGLVVVDTYTQFTLFGQVVILALIQIGGLGFMTLALFFPMALGRRIGLRERSVLMESVSAPQLGGVIRLMRHVLIGTLLIEGTGAILLALRFIPRFGFRTGLWYGVFHAISGFCNAGFDLLGVVEPYSSITHFADDPVIVLTLCALIAIGGIGFIVWEDVVRNGVHLRRYSFHAKVVLLGTAILIVGGTVILFLSERNTVLSGLTAPQRLLRALFQSVSPRTAGFNSVDIAALSQCGAFTVIFLMFIGAAPGSTGGGIKVSTAAVLFSTVYSHIRGAEDTNLMHRRVAPETVRKALCAVTLYVMLCLGGVFVILLLQDLPLKDVLLECFSAIGTVGLSTGITRSLAPLSRVVLIALMFAGRVGSLTVFMTVAERESESRLRNPVEKIVVG